VTPRLLTDTAYWDDFWRTTTLPVEITKESNLYTTAITDALDHYLPVGRDLSALEVGGAPAQYLAYLHRRFGYHVAALDSSPIGCSLTRRNFELLGIPGEVLERDLFSEGEISRRFDVVYSLGLIEHAADPESLVALVGAHLRFVRPGGTLAVGCPNYLGVNRLLAARFAPEKLRTHNLQLMDCRAWSAFEREFQLETLFKGYVGGFEASLLSKGDAALAVALRVLGRVLNRKSLRLLRRLNSRAWSGYALGFYRVPSD
jgi:SAM-dependent methyltransferase